MHFTYQPPEGDLQQGDVLARTPEIDAILAQVHPHYHGRTEYRNLIVLTQSCELVRRADSPTGKARYITVAAVRPLQTAITRELKKWQRSAREVRARYCSSGARLPMRQFVERLLNNNEPGYFYLHRDSTLQLDEERVAFLTLSIALKADLHYETLLAGRLAQLKPEFQAKLGELVGNIYSRVGTADWYEHVPDEDFRAMVEEIVERQCRWVDDEFMQKISREEKRKAKVQPGYEMSEADVAALVEELATKRANKRRVSAEKAAEILLEIVPGLNERDLERFQTRLLNDSGFAS